MRKAIHWPSGLQAGFVADLSPRVNCTGWESPHGDVHLRHPFAPFSSMSGIVDGEHHRFPSGETATRPRFGLEHQFLPGQPLVSNGLKELLLGFNAKTSSRSSPGVESCTRVAAR